MDLSGNHAKDGVAESPDSQPVKTEPSSLTETDEHSLPEAAGNPSSAAPETPFPASVEAPGTADAGDRSNDSPGDGPSDDSESIFNLFDIICEVPKEASFGTALENVQVPVVEYGKPFRRFIRLFTANNSFKPSVWLTGEPTTSEPGVSIRMNPEQDSICICGTVSRPYLLEITIPYAIQDPQNKEPVPGIGKISLSITDPDFTGEVVHAYQENIQKPDGLEKSPSFPRWSREGEQYEGKCDISEFVSLCGGRLKLCKCDVLYKDTQEPVAGVRASAEGGKLQISGVPAKPGQLMFRFVYSNGQQADLTDNDDIIEIVPSAFFERIDELVDAFRKMPPKQAMAGNDIRHEIPLPDPFDPDRMSIIDPVPSDPSLSAVYDCEKKVVEVTGTPGGSGAISLTFTLHAETELGHEITETVTIPLFELCSDTKSLWKNLPTDSTAPYQAEDEEHAVIEAGARTILAASKRGRSHAHRGKFRDDNFKACYIRDTGWIVVAVSDGAGSAQYSREGSRIICDTFCETMRLKLSSGEFGEPVTSDLENKLRSAILDAARQGLDLIEKEAGSMSRTDADVTVKDYSATLLGYVMKQFEDGWLIVSIGIGDGVIGLLDRSDQVLLLSCPDHGEYSGQTRFLTTSDVWTDDPISRTSAVRIKDFKAIFSMSDGVSDPKFETENDMNDPRFWVGLWDEISRQVPLAERSGKTAGKLSEWLDFVSRGYNDDRTIVLVY